MSPKWLAGKSSNIRRQTAGQYARFLPPGHSSSENSMGQFSMATFTLLEAAWSRIGPHVSRNRGQLASTLLVKSRPMKVVTVSSSSFAAASMTVRMWATAAAASSASGDRALG